VLCPPKTAASSPKSLSPRYGNALFTPVSQPRVAGIPRASTYA
jgi:hypothetical protein